MLADRSDTFLLSIYFIRRFAVTPFCYLSRRSISFADGRLSAGAQARGGDPGAARAQAADPRIDIICLCTCISLSVDVCIYIYIYIYTCIKHIYIYIYIHVYIYIYISEVRELNPIGRMWRALAPTANFSAYEFESKANLQFVSKEASLFGRMPLQPGCSTHAPPRTEVPGAARDPSPVRD